MSRVTLILRSLAFHWRAHLAAGLASAVGTAVLVGALLVGDSVRHSLRSMAVERLGEVQNAILGGDRFFRADLARRMSDAGKQSPPYYKAMIVVPGVCIHDTSGALAGQAQILGVPPDFGEVGAHWPRETLGSSDVFINEQLATALNAKVGDVVRLRVSKPNLLSLEAPTGPKEAKSAVLRATVRAILPNRGLGRFSFDANQIPPPNAYVPLAELQDKLEQKGRANVLLSLMYARQGSKEFSGALPACWSLDDAQLRLRPDEKLGFIELSTPRVFLDSAVCDALFNHEPETTNQKPTAVLTYFVNAIRANAKETPYSMVAAGEAPLVPSDLKEDEVLLNDWTAEDLGAKPGDKIELEYFTVGMARKLETHKNTFTVKAIVPIDGRYADKGLMPEFPGIAEVDSTHDWDSSIPIDMRKIRAKDEDYWKAHRGTPKAFIALAAGVRMWENRFGTYTALRFPFTSDPQNAQAAVDEHIRRAVDPAAVGLKFTPVRALALQAGAQAQDFGQLFLGFSFFLIVAALLLMALIFRFNVEARASETGLLLALGFTPRVVRGLLWVEGALMASLGGVLGVGGGIVYAQWLLHALATRWLAAVGTSALEYHAESASLAIGYGAGVAAAAIAIYLAARRQAALSARELLNATGLETPQPTARGRIGLYVAGACVCGAAALVAKALCSDELSAAGAFFGAGALLLIAALAAVRFIVSERSAGGGDAARMAGGASAWSVLARFGVRACARRTGRSLATAALLACGSFLIVAVGANQQDAGSGAARKESGTGGFALMARATLPVYEDLNTPAGRAKAGVADEGLAGATIYQFRVKDGDEASCLNLNRAQKPRILGVPASFIRRGGFTFAAVAADAQTPNPWLMLQRTGAADAAIPALCDYQSLTWALGMKVGDTLRIPDEKGTTRNVRIVGAVANSILQGSVLISEEAFVGLYPSESGYREFLIDAPPERAEAVAKFLSSALPDEGFQATPAVKRLAQFNAVQNTYLATFQALGALGMLLGSLGLGIVVLRNVVERRGELALLRALGFSRANLGWLVLSEHAWLLLLGLSAGVLSALVAVAPALRATGVPVPWAAIGVSLVAIVACGLGSAVLATWALLRGPLLPALRNE